MTKVMGRLFLNKSPLSETLSEKITSPAQFISLFKINSRIPDKAVRFSFFIAV